MPPRVKFYVALVIALGLVAAGVAVASWGSVTSPERMAIYVALTALASLVKLRLPGLEGTYSLNAIFLLAGAVYFTLPEAVMAAVAGVLVQSFAGANRRPTFVQAIFNISNEVFSIAVASLSLSYLVGEGILPFRPALLAAAAAVYFVLNTGLVSGILTLLGGGEFREVNKQWYSMSFPYYLLGAAVVGVLPIGGRPIDFEACAVLIPLAYLSHFLCGLAERRGESANAVEDGPVTIPWSAKAFAGAVAATAASVLAYAVNRTEPIQWTWFLCFLALAVVTATWKVRLPGTTGTISVDHVIVFVALAQTGMFEALVISAVGPLVQTLWRAKVKPQPIQILFNVAVMVVATGVAFWGCRILGGSALQSSLPAFLASAAVLYFLVNTFLVAIVLSLVGEEGVVALWRRVYFWAFPIYMVGAAAAAVMIATARSAGWVPSLLILPLMAMTQFSYRIQIAGHFRQSVVAPEPA